MRDRPRGANDAFQRSRAEVLEGAREGDVLRGDREARRLRVAPGRKDAAGVLEFPLSRVCAPPCTESSFQVRQALEWKAIQSLSSTVVTRLIQTEALQMENR